MTRLYLVRHGEVEANREMRYLGRRDDPMTERGREHAAAFAALFEAVPVGRVLSSPLSRCRDTAAVIAAASGVPIEVDPRLLEMDFGGWEGRTRDDVRGADPTRLAAWEDDPERVAPPGGESLGDVRGRVLALVAELSAAGPDDEVAIVSHVGPLKILLCEAVGLGLAAARRMFLDPGTVSVVDWSRIPVLRLFNSHAHFGWPNARWMETRHGVSAAD